MEKGYKQTEIGVLPEDWEVKELGSIGKFSKGKGIKKDEVRFEGKRCIRYGELYTIYNNIITSTKSFIDTETAKKSVLIRQGDILFAGSGETKEDIGKCATYDIDDECYAGGDTIILTPTGDDSNFLGSLLNNSNIRFQKSQLAQGDAVVHIYPNSLQKIKIPVPPLPEQEKIAEALSDADAWIESLEQLLAKKRLIKQGAMQKLLTPPTDAEPAEAWEEKKLGEVAEILDNLRKPLNDSERQKMKGEFPYCGANGVVDYVKDFLIDDDIILMAEDGGYFDEYKTRPIAYKMTGKCWVNNHAHILKVKNHCQDFIFYSLVHKDITGYITGGTRAKLNKGVMKEIVINIPKSLAEQTRIATILSDMDSELEALEAQLAKARQLKQGMMQVLLTGKVRI